MTKELERPDVEQWSCPDKRYHKLRSVFIEAEAQASTGKGNERHADEQNFENQPILILEKMYQSGVLFQAAKKMHESQRLPTDRAINELLGAINYLAARIIYLQWKDQVDAR
jgi:hypothetical protein